jgi:hypothetical protein
MYRYSEAISLLYSTNTFYIVADFYITDLVRLVPASHLAQIRSVVFYIKPHSSTSAQAWKRILAHLHAMPKLQNCRLIFRNHNTMIPKFIELLDKMPQREACVFELVHIVHGEHQTKHYETSWKYDFNNGSQNIS